MVLFSLLLAALIGISLGVLGSGGSIVTMPVLVYAAGVPPQRAVGMSLVIVGATSLAGAVANLRRGSFAPRAAVFFILSGMAGSVFGARFTHWVTGRTLLLLFGITMLAAGVKMLLSSPAPPEASRCRPGRCLLAGLLVGVLTGFLGVGGGFLILPALVMFGGIEMKSAVGTSLAIIAANSFAGLAGHLSGVNLDWGLTLAFGLSALAGMAVGLVIVGRVSAERLSRGFAWTVIVVGVFLLLKNAPVH
jgi:uncharacterized membrane protein YfcA